MNPSLLAAVAQLAPTVDGARNREQIAALTADAARSGARLVVFPEESMLLAGEVEGRLGEVVDAEWPLFLAQLSLLAVEHELWIIAGGYEPSGSDRPYNTLVVVNSRGEVVESYRKLHLYDAFAYRESDYVTGGTELPPVVLIEGVAVGLVNCYDIRFPELSRDLVARGADVLSVSAAWVAGARKEAHWETLVKARAIENTCWVLASSSTSPECIGNSLVIDPLGVERAGLGPVASGVALVEISLDRTAEVRETLPALANRRLTTSVAVSTPTAAVPAL
ncbi:carbon-nitrogen hydrolase family protein [Herbiconiux sp. CPCC 203407]|uniref:Carbon-nitrogen hydrolase family protein n=1 Tax=Herbiconiux oxytropis TaxID=2970915 RepID=A0AA41XC15_9MICO|nr:carbon-nitrogen hydrolase family protein [Herbiconiux oxytropis]MCS5723767.1 carbon-nitrogen hydrolase family protein [Herbiconiux oxytropis]MCS5725267.1 carbon-nitrogen hydrolase family protein [Herbiconiux oxytropis]